MKDNAMPQSLTYDKQTVVLHWLTAVLVLGLWAVGQTIDWFPKGAPRVNVRSLHIVFGLILAIVVIRRILWRKTGGTQLPAADVGVKGRASVAVHYVLYLLLLGVIAIGITAVWFRGDTIFGLFTVPAFDPADRVLRRNVVELHGLMANVLFFTAAFHAAAAVLHHAVLKDGMLRRMWPGLRP
jgi:cytochrome b561